VSRVSDMCPTNIRTTLVRHVSNKCPIFFSFFLFQNTLDTHSTLLGHNEDISMKVKYVSKHLVKG